MGAANNPKLWAGGETHCGHVREANQDVIIVEPRLGLYAVLDGMGGANAGDVAAQLAAQEIVAYVRRRPRARRLSPLTVLTDALHVAAVRVFTAAKERRAYRGMGTTVVACLIPDPTCAAIAHAGDSRAYRLRGRQLTALTMDHTAYGSHALTRNLGMECGVQPALQLIALQQGDRLLLCSDGLYGGAPGYAIERVMRGRDAPERIARQLVAEVLAGDAGDNVSAVVIAVDDGRARTATRAAARRARAPATGGSRASKPRRSRRGRTRG
jgi:protein phosphatase